MLIDPLTGLGNRRAFDESLEAELTRAARYHRPFSVVMIDLDGLKQINDAAGHAAGDTALRAMAEGFRRTVRATDSAHRVTEAVSPAFSWGAATYLDDTRDRSEVVALADRQLIERRLRRRG